MQCVRNDTITFMALGDERETNEMGKRGPDTKPRKRRTDNPVPPPNYKGRNAHTGLPKGAVAAIRSAKRRVPEGTDDESAQIAQEAFDTMVKVMRGEVPIRRLQSDVVDGAGQVVSSTSTVIQSPTLSLTAARLVRDDVCGPPTQRIELKDTTDMAERIRDARLRTSTTPEEDTE
jgi:hypothetical protein